MKPFDNFVEKGENVGNQHFLLFPQCFLPSHKQFSIFQPCLFYCLQKLSIWTCLKTDHTTCIAEKAGVPAEII